MHITNVAGALLVFKTRLPHTSLDREDRSSSVLSVCFFAELLLKVGTGLTALLTVFLISNTLCDICGSYCFCLHWALLAGGDEAGCCGNGPGGQGWCYGRNTPLHTFTDSALVKILLNLSGIFVMITSW